MPEKPVRIPVEEGKLILEGLLDEGKNGRSVLLCHPHPLYGGNMHNNVVLAAQQTFAGQGWGTLRFNFRGAGGSGGEPAQGDKDAEDLLAVSQFLREKFPLHQQDLAAYSYGAWVGLKAVRLGLSPEVLALFSPPLDFIGFEGLALPDAPVLITLGNQDEFCSVESLRNWLAGQAAANRATLDIFPYGDHFYWGAEQVLTRRINSFLEKNVVLS